ncbi:trimeric intracellular cation channel family protein [Pedobacter agri]|uniref:Trimeric intracellular cation channel family protein n=1 Tax=Pedobacter agri TaxID=454586 RepID=A0A9X3DFG7_9SPHI|nr:trimeric intracellular cation channel family protein [Pedobacter agri]MCX3266180.1 trimeric intracellular cation channel family protein [Pedobacter agri]MDQ1139877.1 putative membrane protein YeiH [Pedobacter agri]
MENYNISTSEVIEVLGTIAFAISGTFNAMQRKLDPFGVLIIAFVTAIGGGTVRDLLIGDTPVAWMRDMQTCLIVLFTALGTMFFKTHVQKLKITLFLFDSLGLGLFTMVGILKGMAFGLNPGICIALGTITGCFGGIIRDTLLNTIPLVFRREIYATACILGGLLYYLLIEINVESVVAKLAVVAFIFVLRIVAVKFKLSLPKFDY